MMVIKRYAYYQYYSGIKLRVYNPYGTVNKPKPIRLQHSLEVPNQIDTTTKHFFDKIPIIIAVTNHCL